ncbi:MAG: hypothetical protein ACI9KE_006513 [Polyangiales bacterium]|jgi:hypothetical protein
MYARGMQSVLRVVLMALPLTLTMVCSCSDGSHSAPPLHGDDWPEPLAGGAVLRWQVTTPNGQYSFETDREGESVYLRDAQEELRVERSLSLAQMSRLRDDLLELNCCNLEGPWRTDVEWMVDWRIRMPGLSCDIAIPAELFDHDELAFEVCEHRLAEEWAFRPRMRIPSPGSVNWPAVRAARRSRRLPPAEDEPEDSE